MKQPAFIIIITLLFPNFCELHAQPQKHEQDSLQKLLKTGVDDTTRINVLLQLADLNYDDTITCINLTKKAYRLSEKLTYYPGKIKCLINYSNMLNQQGLFDRSHDTMKRAEIICKQEKIPVYLIIRIQQTIGNILLSKGNYKEGVKKYIDILPLAESTNDWKRFVGLINNISIAYRETEQYNLALKYALQTLQFRNKITDKTDLANIYSTIGSVYEDLAVDDSSLKYFLISHKYRLQQNNTQMLAASYNNIGISYFNKKQFHLAAQNCLKANTIWEETQNEKGLVNSYIMLGNIFKENNDFDKAIYYFKKGLALAKKIGFLLMVQDYYYYLAETYYQNKQFKDAYESNQKYVKIHDSIVNIDSRDHMIEMETKYETEKKEKENIVLQSKNEINTLELKRQTTQRNTLVIILTLILFSGFILYNRFRLKNKNKLLEEKNLRSTAVFKAQEEEKSKLSKELHDGVGPLLSLIKLQVSALENSIGDKQTINEIKNLANEGIKEVRNISHALMPTVLERNGLKTALNEFANQINQNASVKLDLNYELTTELPPGTQLNIYRIVQEAINNTLKYAQASLAKIHLKNTSNGLELTISDNGRGFDANKVKSGNGLNNIYSRVDVLKGNIHVQSKPGEGTRFDITIPKIKET